MAESYYSILTSIGKAQIANALGLGTKVDFVTMKVGDGNGSYYNPTESQTDLVHTVWEGAIGQVAIDEDNSNWINIEVLIPPDVGDFFIREYCVFDASGNMLAIAKCAETYKPLPSDGSTKEINMKMVLAISNTSSITLKIDPTIIFAKKKDVDEVSSRVDALTTQLSEITQKQNKFTEDANGKLLYNGNKVGATKASELTLDPISGMSSTNVQAGIAEAFQYANNGKTSIANVVGKVTGSNTHAQIASEIQTDKNTMATNITSKGITANGTETLASLAGKVGQISVASLGGRKFATNTTSSSSSATSFTYLDGSTGTFYYLSVNGLSFKPTLIIAIGWDNSLRRNLTITYDELGLTSNNYPKVARLLDSSDSPTRYETYTFKADVSSASVYNGGFTLPSGSGTYTWFAFE